MNEQTPGELNSFPATRWSDTIFGACAGATLCTLTALVIQAVFRLKVDVLQVVFAATMLGGLIGSIAGFVQYSFRKTFDNSELGVRLGVAFAILPSLVLLVSVFEVANGTIPILFIAAMGFAGIMAGVIAGGLLDRLYENVLNRR